MNKKGITFVAIVMIIALLIIIASGVSMYIVESSRFSVSSINKEKAYSMAQLGLLSGLTAYINAGEVSWNPSSASLPGGLSWQVGRDADFLRVDASNVQIRANAKVLQRLPIKNVSTSNSITITDVMVEWNFGGTITGMTIGGTNVWPGGTFTTGQNINITDRTIAANTTFSGLLDQTFTFSNFIRGNIIVTFYFKDTAAGGDNSYFRTYILKDNNDANIESSFTGIGRVQAGTTTQAGRRITATYATGTNRITSWEESLSAY